MSTSATSTQLGRQFWAAIRDSANTLAARLPGRQPPLTRVGLGYSPWASYHNQPTRWLVRAYQSRVSPKNVRKSCTSGGLLLLGLSSSPSSTGSVMSTCTAVADSAFSGNAVQRAKLTHLARQAWLASSQSTGRGGQRVPGTRANSSSTKGDGGKKEKPLSQPNSEERSTEEQRPADSKPSEASPSEHDSLTHSMYNYLHLPKMPHRPTKEELLSAANGFLERLRVRFKWFSIRSMRPWNADEWGAFVSWFLFGHLVWVLVGTTTFFSLIILFINTVFAQGRPWP